MSLGVLAKHPVVDIKGKSFKFLISNLSSAIAPGVGLNP